MNSFSRGAFTPLLSVRQPLMALSALLLLTACSASAPPPFTASGYVDNDGVVRIWRKDDANGDIHLFTAFSPWSHDKTATSEYRWHGDKLTSIERSLFGETPERVKIRFDARGGLSFMQHDVEGHKQQLSEEKIALYRYYARQVRDTSDALRSGRVVLLQGRWQPDGTVINCEGQRLTPTFSDAERRHIWQRQHHSSLAVSLAWLEAPGGTQLLLVANEDYCHWQPNPKTF
ncbi:DUF1481 domain-containing protein [Jejubacter calystegiae]|uniref:DUF1481 domain-containing protein n=1 Tax=Jejubacter calystegiae TaxID=2579935 RepID=A0A4P8YQN3_9ENTR|nr:DUF1481 domain-containing protein [Jejubacter calystegiae]QCT22623.1 DUF1481 domain-containing protein [Jejubacter calystegiae]